METIRIILDVISIVFYSIVIVYVLRRWKAGITQAMLCWIERGTRNPTLQVGMAIAKVLGCTVEDLLAGYEPGAMENDSQQEGA